MKRIAGKIVLYGIELISSDSRENVQAGIDGRTVLGKVEGRKRLDAADDGFDHVAGVGQPLVGHR